MNRMICIIISGRTSRISRISSSTIVNIITASTTSSATIIIISSTTSKTTSSSSIVGTLKECILEITSDREGIGTITITTTIAGAAAGAVASSIASTMARHGGAHRTGCARRDYPLSSPTAKKAILDCSY